MTGGTGAVKKYIFFPDFWMKCCRILKVKIFPKMTLAARRSRHHARLRNRRPVFESHQFIRILR
jgi:hypothetical protein